MWEAIGKIFTSSEFLLNVPAVIVLIIALCVLVKVMHVRVNTGHIQIGGEPIEAYYERKIVQEQCDYAHIYLNGLVSKIADICIDGKLVFDGWMTKYVLEVVYDEFVIWIHYNHIMDDDAYISAKQNKIRMLVYSFPVKDEFKTKEFADKMDIWVADIIHELVRIRKVYREQMKL